MLVMSSCYKHAARLRILFIDQINVLLAREEPESHL